MTTLPPSGTVIGSGASRENLLMVFFHPIPWPLNLFSECVVVTLQK